MVLARKIGKNGEKGKKERWGGETHGMATVMTMPSRAWTAVAMATVLLRTLVAETSQRITKQTGPTEKS